MIAIRTITSEKYISVKIAGVVVMIYVVWYTFVASTDALHYPPHAAAQTSISATILKHPITKSQLLNKRYNCLVCSRKLIREDTIVLTESDGLGDEQV